MGKLVKKNIFVAVILCVFFIFSKCKTLPPVFQEPVISLHSAELTNITVNNVQFLFKVQVQNPNNFEIPFPKTDWEVFINAKSFISGVVVNDRKIKARSTVFIDVPVKLEYPDILKTFISLKNSKQADYKAALAVNFSLPGFGNKVWNFDFEGKLPFPQLPRVDTPTLVINSINSVRAEIFVTVNVENPNEFEIPAPKFSYDYQLNKNSFIKGIIENEAPLAPTSVTPIKFRMVVNYPDLFRNFTSLSSVRETASLLILTCDFGIPVFNDENRRFEVSGVLPLRR